jgi:hypothetical protein
LHPVLSSKDSFQRISFLLTLDLYFFMREFTES